MCLGTLRLLSVQIVILQYLSWISLVYYENAVTIFLRTVVLINVEIRKKIYVNIFFFQKRVFFLSLP